MEGLVLRDYQQVGVDFLRSHRRAMLTDSPGLGKTLQASAAATTPCLISCPTYLVAQWWEFLERQYPSHSVVSASEDMDDLGTNPKRLTREQRTEALQQRADWTIINHEMLREVKHRTVDTATGEVVEATQAYKFPGGHYRTLIIDESHFMRGRNASTAKRAVKLAHTIPNVFELTGTPIYNEVDDLYMQWRILDPQTFKSYWKFVGKFALTEADEYTTRIVGINPAALDTLARVKHDLTLGRTYEEVGMVLPPLHENVIRLPLDPEQSAEYSSIKSTLRANTHSQVLTSASQVLDALRTFTRSSDTLQRKYEAIQAILHAHSAAGQGAVIFCWYRETAAALAHQFNATLITGALTPRKRLLAANRTPPSHNIVATLASLSEGVDLSRYRTVIFAEEDYVPGRMEQAIARVRRYRHVPTEGDNRRPSAAVNAYYLHIANTADEVVHYVWQHRATDAATIMRLALAD
jgi:superfamily II DNA or RNA helicase